MTHHEIASVLASSGIVPSSASPLSSISPAGKAAVPAKGFPKKSPADSLRAVRILAQPRWELGVMLSHPWTEEPKWMYMAEEDSNTAIAWIKEGGADVSQDLTLLTVDDVTKRMGACLGLDAPCESGMLRLKLSMAGFAAFLAAIDGVRRAALMSLLDHVLPPPEIRLSLSDVGSHFAKTLAAGDHRWLSSLTARLCPWDIPTSPAELQAGMQELVSAKLLEPSSPQVWRPAPGFLLVCDTLSSPLASACLSHHDLLKPGSSADHLIGLRGLGALWLLEFSEKGGHGTEVKLRDVSGAEMELALDLRLQKKIRPAPPSTTVPPKSSPARTAAAAESSAAACPSCRSPLKPGARFCTRCGAAINR
ncbi:MAG: zinc ribbon domain-containing protein [Roseimicrobium sp.]